MTTRKPKSGPACTACGRALKNPASIELGTGPVCRSKNGSLLTASDTLHPDTHRKPETLQQPLSAWKVEVDDLPPADMDIAEFPYRGHGGCACICRLRIWFLETHTVGMVSALPHNSGTSVTNAAATLWGSVRLNFGITASLDFFKIEHYPAEPRSHIPACRSHRYDLVTIKNGEPKWSHFGPKRTRDLIGQAPELAEIGGLS